MKIPDSILKKLEAAEKKNREYEESKKIAKKAEKDKIERINKYRQTKMAELVPAAEKIMEWVNEFRRGSNSEGERILRVAHSVYLYVGKFWDGEPIPESQVTCCAVLCIHKNGQLCYEERHKGRTSYEKIVGNKKMIIKNLHPDFVLGAARAIEDGTVWEYIERSIPKPF